MEYRVRYIINSSKHSSTQYYNVFHSSEALDFLAHTFRRGHIEGKELRIIAVEEFDRFSQKWINRIKLAVEHTRAAEIVSEGGKVWLRKKN